MTIQTRKRLAEHYESLGLTNHKYVKEFEAAETAEKEKDSKKGTKTAGKK